MFICISSLYGRKYTFYTCPFLSGCIHNTKLFLSSYSIRSLEFWFNHLYNHEGNACSAYRLNRGLWGGPPRL